MAGDTVIIESGAVETRAALIRGGAPTRFWFGPALGGEAREKRLLPGCDYIGRITKADRSLGGAFLDIGAEAFLPIKNDFSAHVVEGARLKVRVLAPPRQQKAATVAFLAPAEATDAPGLIGPAPPAPILALEALKAKEADVLTDSAEAQGVIAKAGLASRMARADEAPLFQSFGAATALDAALAQTVSLPGGGSLSFHETEALTAIDIDAGALASSSSDRLREKTISAAADAISLEITRRNLAGRIAADFPSIRNKDVRDRAETTIRNVFSALIGVSSLNVTRGLFTTLTRERRGLTLWEETTEPAPSAPVPGRRFTADWLAKSAVRALEWRQAARPSARLALHAGSVLYAHLIDVAAAERYFARWGAALAILKNAKLEENGFDLVEDAARS